MNSRFYNLIRVAIACGIVYGVLPFLCYLIVLVNVTL